MGIENLRWWHWSLLSLGLGWLLAYMNAGTIEPTGMRTEREMAFEQAVLHAPVGQEHIPWIRNLVVYPVTPAEGPGGKPIEIMPVIYEVLMPKPGGQPNEFEYEETWFGASVPYVPDLDRRVITEGNLPDPATGDARLPPGVERTFVPDADATLSSIAAAVYGRDTLAGRDALALANAPLRLLRAADPVSRLFPTGRLRQGQAILIPWNPEKRMTVRDWLDAAGTDHAWIEYRFAWWKVPQYANEVWIGGSFLLIGLIWPATVSLMSGAGLGRRHVSEEEYDLTRFGKGPGKSARKPAAAAEIGDEQLQKVAAMNQSLTASLGDVLGQAGKSAPADKAASPAPPKPFVPAPADPSAPPVRTAEPEKEYTGEFYPVALPKVNPPDAKPPQAPEPP